MNAGKFGRTNQSDHHVLQLTRSRRPFDLGFQRFHVHRRRAARQMLNWLRMANPVQAPGGTATTSQVEYPEPPSGCLVDVRDRRYEPIALVGEIRSNESFDVCCEVTIVYQGEFLKVPDLVRSGIGAETFSRYAAAIRRQYPSARRSKGLTA